MRKSLLFGIIVNFIGSCYFTGEAIKGNIVNPSPYEDEAALIACIFLLGLAIGFSVYEEIFKSIKKTDSQ